MAGSRPSKNSKCLSTSAREANCDQNLDTLSDVVEEAMMLEMRKARVEMLEAEAMCRTPVWLSTKIPKDVN